MTIYMKNKLLTLLLIFVSSHLFAFNEEITNKLVGNQVKNDTIIEVRDNDFPTYTGIKYVKSGVQVRLFFDESIPKNYSSNFRVKIEYELKLYGSNTSTALIYPLTHEIELDYIGAGPMNDFSHTYHHSNINQVRAAQLKVKKITTQSLDINGMPIGSPTVLTSLTGTNYNSIKLELKYIAEKVKPLYTGTITQGHLVKDASGTIHDLPAYVHHLGGATITSSSKEAVGNEVKIYWTSIQGGEWYDVEWVFIDGGNDNLMSTNYPIDWKNATRVQTTFSYYSIPMLYPRGKLVYRVRGVGYDTATAYPFGLKYTNWTNNSTNTSQGIGTFVYGGLNRDLNWTATTTYAENGKQKSILSVFDPFGKQRQALTSISTDSLLVVSENVYDHMGRPSVQLLPIVKDFTGLMFTGVSNTSFLKEDFDLDANYASLGNPLITSPTMSGNQISDFYSDNNNFYSYTGSHYPKMLRKDLAGYIADAEGYAYQQTRYSNDGSGRPHSQSLPGVTHRLGSGHETKYYYGAPGSQAEIDRLFGNEAGFVANYKKEMVVDANGQVSVSYKDGYNRVIATALAGEETSNLLHTLPSATNFPTIKSSALGNNHINYTNELVATKTILISSPGTPVLIEYEADTAMFKDVCLGDIPCKFEVSISLVDEEGGHLIDFNNLNGFTDEPSYLPFNGTTGFSFTHTVSNLEIGKYTLVKKVRLIDYIQDSSIVSHLNSVIGTDTSNASTCFTPPLYENPCMSCEQKCEDIYSFSYVYDSIAYKIYRVSDSVFVGLTTDSLIALITDESGSYLFKLITSTEADSIDNYIDNCKEICNTTPSYDSNNECDILLAVLKSDLSPGGQYFDNRPQDPNISGISNPNYLIASYSGPESINHWLINYADNYLGGGTSFAPNFAVLLGDPTLTWNDIRNNWGTISSKPSFDSLMNEFVKIHPEYCMWKAKCENRNDTCRCNGGTDRLYPTIADYENAMYNTYNDTSARDGYLFYPTGVVDLSTPSIFHPSYIDPNICFDDPIIVPSCKGSKTGLEMVTEKLLNFIEDNGDFFSIYDILADTSYRWVDINTYSGPRTLAFVSYMQTLHGIGAQPGLLPSAFGVAPGPNQMSYYSYFRSNYDFLRATIKNELEMAKIFGCFPSNHWLKPVLVDTSSLPSPLNSKVNELPYLSFLDMDGDGKFDIDLDAYGLGLTGTYISPVGFDIRIPYISLLTNNTPAGLTADFCNSLVSSMANQWLSSMQNMVSGCKELELDGIGINYSTEPHIITPVNEQYLLSYFTIIAQEACDVYIDSLNNGYIPIGNFGNGISSPTIYSSHVWGAPSSNSVDAVITLYQSQFSGSVIGCPTTLSQINFSDSLAMQESKELQCNCGQLMSLLQSSGTIYSQYENVYPFIYDQIPGVYSASDLVDLTEFADFVNLEANGLLTPYVTINENILSHWITMCKEGKFIEDPSLDNNGVFPDEFNCTLNEIIVDSCGAEYKAYYRMLKYDAFIEFKNNQWQKFENKYDIACLERLINKEAETLDITYILKEYHYTLYYYDRAGNLVKTVPPEGVYPIDHVDTLSKISKFRIEHSWKDTYTTLTDSGLGQFRRPAHTKITHYLYDSKEQVIRQKTPDGGETFTYYDFLGRVAISQNEKQKNYYNEAASYTLYDSLGRIKEVGEWEIDLSNLDSTKTIREYIASLPDSTYLTYDQKLEIVGSRRQITRTYYDVKVVTTDFNMNNAIFEQNNLRNRVATVAYYEKKPKLWKFYDNAIHYNYDIHGNVKTQVQDMPILHDFGKQFLFTNYEYDLVSGNVNSVHFMPNQPESYSHYYYYDADNRITRVYTSSNGGLTKDLDAKYYYHLLGPLARVELGKHQVQGIDYTYNLQGWIKGVNTDKLNPNNDRGTDGLSNSNNLHRNFGIDAMGYTLGYHDNDYKAIGNTSSTFKPFELQALGSDSAENYMSVTNSFGNGYGLYNGNIVKMVSNTLDCDENYMDVLGRFYQYDQLNRIMQSKAATITHVGVSSSNSETWGIADYGNRFRTNYSYDADGNILNLKRYSGTATLMDNISYTYTGLNNRLMSVTDPISTPAITTDIEGTSNFNYDAIGNLISDSNNDNSQITWTVYGKVKRVDFNNKADLWFGYNPMGNRVVKRVLDSLNNKEKLMVYALDAQGNQLAVYEVKNNATNYELKCTERLLYGSSRLGMNKKSIELKEITNFAMDSMENSMYEFLDPFNATPNTLYANQFNEKHFVGFKEYELNNHLGNVLSTVSDRKLPKNSMSYFGTRGYIYAPDVRSANEYYPFGSMLEGWGCTQSVDCIETPYTYIDTLVNDNYQTGLVGDLVTAPYYSYSTNNGAYVSYVSEITGNKYLVYHSTRRTQTLQREILGVQHGKTYTAKFKVRKAFGDVTVMIRKYEKSNLSNTSNATSTVISAGTSWDTASISFTVDTTFKYVIDFRNANPTYMIPGPAEIHVDDILIWGEAEGSYLSCTGDTTGYRYGFNGKEMDNEVKGNGAQYDYGFRIYDPRLGRFLSVDPLTASYPWYTPYQFAGNQPINAIDLDGLEEYEVIRWIDQKGAHQSSEITVWVAGQHSDDPLINKKIPANTDGANAYIIEKNIETGQIINTSFGELNDTERSIKLTKVEGYIEGQKELAFDKDNIHYNWSKWKGSAKMPPPPNPGRPFVKGQIITRYKYNGISWETGSIYNIYLNDPKAYVKNIVKDLAATPNVTSINIRYDIFSSVTDASKLPASNGLPTVYEAAEIGTKQMKSLFEKELKKAGLDIKVTTSKPLETKVLESAGFKITPK